MAETFDPYHRWLGIPPKYRPPNHYRLLGLETGESDPEVIRDAAERQMAHVRQYQLGQHAELSQRILNELGAAKACLLDAERRAAYDASLKNASLPAATPLPQPAEPGAKACLSVPPELANGLGTPPLPPTLPPLQLPVAFEPAPMAQRRSSAWVTGGLVAATTLAGLAAVLWSQGRLGMSPAVVAPQTQAPEPGATPVDSVLATTEAPAPHVEQAPKPSEQAPAPEEAKPVAPATRETTDWQPVLNVVGRAVARLQVRRTDGTVREGSGFVADPTGLLVTSAALVENAAVTAGFTDGSTETLSAPVTLDRRLGLAVFHIKPIAMQPVMTCALVPVPGAPLGLCRIVTPEQAELSPIELRGTAPRKEMLRRLERPPEHAAHGEFGLDTTLWLDVRGTLRAEDCGAPVLNASGQLVGLLAWSDPARNAHFAVPAGEIDALLARSRDDLAARQPVSSPPKTAPAMPAATTPPRPLGLFFPSGREFSDTFFSSGSDPHWLSSSLRSNPNEVIELVGVGGFPSGLVRPGSSGTAAVFYDRKATRPGIAFDYHRERRNGLVQTWNAAGERTYCCQYRDGRREGLGCLMEAGQPRVALEFSGDKCNGVLLIANMKIEKSFTDFSAAQADPQLAPKLADLEKIESEVDRIEKILNKEYADALKRREIRKRVGQHNEEARERIQKRIEKRDADRKKSMDALKQKVGAPL